MLCKCVKLQLLKLRKSTSNKSLETTKSCSGRKCGHRSIHNNELMTCDGQLRIYSCRMMINFLKTFFIVAE